jgi:hypothetical protein
MSRSFTATSLRPAHHLAALRGVLCLATLALLSACASVHPQLINESREAAQYAAQAARDYPTPGTPDDPWGPYISQAANRFDVPERWIREVMRVESGGQEFVSGQLTTSPVGAMGLMQVMPGTYDGLKQRYGLGDDAYNPENNILAGAAYMREMYDLYGSPGFLAAYNAGPARLDDYLVHNRALPDETRRYVAMIGPYIQDSWPVNRSPAEQLAINQIPIDIPPGPRYRHERSYAGPVVLAQARQRGVHSHAHGRTQLAARALPQSGHGFVPRVQTAMAVSHGSRFHLIAQAAAATLPPTRGGNSGGGWAIQVGAYASQGQARAAADAARGAARQTLAEARPAFGAVRQPHATLYRARFTGLSREAAIHACGRLIRGREHCIVLSPNAQS